MNEEYVSKYLTGQDIDNALDKATTAVQPEDLDELKEDLSQLSGLNVTWIEDKYINSSGSESNAPSSSSVKYYASDYIDIKGAFSIAFENYNYYGLYDSEKNVISTTSTGTENAKAVNISVPSNACYLRYTKEVKQHNSRYYAYVSNIKEMGKNLLEAIEAINDITGSEKDISRDVNYTIHGYIKPDGTIATISASYYYSDTIELNEGETISLYAKGATVVSALSKWSADGTNWISNIKSYETTGEFETIEHTALTKEYVRISYFEVLPVVKIVKSGITYRIEKVENMTTNLSESVEEVEKQVLDNLTTSTKDVSSEFVYHDHAYIKNNGEIASIGAAYYYSDVYKLEAGESITIYAQGAPAVSAISNWSEDGLTWKSNIQSYAEAQVFETIEHTAEDTEYIRISYFQVLPVITATKLGIPDKISTFDSKISFVNSRIDNVENEIKEGKTNYLAMYKSIVCCGDSLTFGAVYVSASGSVQAFNPYPSVLAMLSGQSVDNLAIGGFKASDWWERYNEEITESNKLYIVYLGTNGGLTNTVDTDCEGSDLNNFAETETGYYGKILQKIQDTHNKAILIKPYTSSGDIIQTKQAIDAFAIKYNTIAFEPIQLTDMYFHYYRGSTSGTNMVHLNDAGYAKFASILYDRICSLSPEDAYKIAPNYTA